jgi:hypothetical protein
VSLCSFAMFDWRLGSTDPAELVDAAVFAGKWLNCITAVIDRLADLIFVYSSAARTLTMAMQPPTNPDVYPDPPIMKFFNAGTSSQRNLARDLVRFVRLPSPNTLNMNRYVQPAERSVLTEVDTAKLKSTKSMTCSGTR